ncbi:MULTISPECIES: hypothetical protein [unclassified Caballeronia]|uniref:hypothetical protein n=1 Tax=unclassified Caballeronia TaxID=2646786 RepID=UPI0028624816|nr:MULTISPECIES: hypothetical protein [unclassified Caballeronia]MDR5754996.1 hypothetical protein [Caballeronia sp. LZ024]MDR5845558.1 hypothetical protein [Caballeronia sp. LZ031]
MVVEKCLLGVCFVPLDSTGQKFFGFSEFLAGLALMVLAWTIGDVRYRFRVRTAPVPLLGITFSVVAIVGVLTLLTDLWRVEQWLVPKGKLLTPGIWQALLGALLLLTFLTWTWFAFIRPTRYGKYNAARFARTLYEFILKGSLSELAVIADELANSVPSLVRHATDWGHLKHYRSKLGEQEERVLPEVEAYANDLLLLIADKRLCRAIVESSPGTALAIFRTMGASKKYGIQVETFARNIVSEALRNRDSFLYHETEGYESGLIGYHQPLSQAMFSNYRMVEAIGTLFDLDFMDRSKWDAAQWQAYCRLVLITFRDYAERALGNHSFVLYRAKGYIENSVSDIYKLDGVTNQAWDDDVHSRLRVVVKFIRDCVEVLDERSVPYHLRLRSRDASEQQPHLDNFYDHLAEMIFEVIFAASAVTSPSGQCWWVQHNSVWRELFHVGRLSGAAGRIVKFKVRRLLYNEVADMNGFPNFKGARILGFCLNVMGFITRQGNYDRDSRALQKVILTWTKKNYVWLHEYNPRVAEACLVDGISYDAQNRRLVRTYLAEGLRREPNHVYLQLDSAP